MILTHKSPYNYIFFFKELFVGSKCVRVHSCNMSAWHTWWSKESGLHSNSNCVSITLLSIRKLFHERIHWYRLVDPGYDFMIVTREKILIIISRTGVSGKTWNPWSAAWWRHQMETLSASLSLCAGNSPVTGEFPAQKPVARSFDTFFDLRLE